MRFCQGLAHWLEVVLTMLRNLEFGDCVSYSTSAWSDWRRPQHSSDKLVSEL